MADSSQTSSVLVSDPSSSENTELTPNKIGRSMKSGSHAEGSSNYDDNDFVVQSSKFGRTTDRTHTHADHELQTTYAESTVVVGDARERKKKGKKISRDEKLAFLKREVEMNEHINTPAAVLAALSSDIKKGLSSEKASSILAAQGPNKLSPPPSNDKILGIVKNFFGGFQILLWIAGLLCFISYGLSPDLARENLYIGIVLVVVVLITGIFTSVQEAASSKVMEGFKKLVPTEAVVIRDSQKIKINAEELVVGDIVEVKTGDKIPADLRLLIVSQLKVDNSSLTGEAEPQSRSVECTNENPLETKNLAFFSTSVVEGSATGIVINTGDSTVIGRIAGLATQTKSKETPIKIEINQFIKVISIIAIIIGIIFLIIGLIKFGVKELAAITKTVVFAIGIIVANVPEGLLATVTVSLTLTAKRMWKKNVLVKNLESVETLGSTSTICSDKTGTLTQNKMSVSHLWFNNNLYSAPTSTQSDDIDRKSNSFKALHNVAALCNRTEFDPQDTETNVKLRRCIGGDASETALIRFCQLERDILEHRQAFQLVEEIPFNSTNKWQVSIRTSENNTNHVVFMKGAPEKIINLCSHVMTKDGTVKLSTKWKKKFTKTYENLGGMGERVLGFCQQELSATHYPVDSYAFNTAEMNWPQDKFVFVGLISLIDPPREAVPEAIQKCRSAHIKVIMVTGDHPLTAEAIARQVGIITGETPEEIAKRKRIPTEEVDDATAIVVTGEQLKEFDDDELDAVLSYDEIVFARTSPQQKLRIVEGCQKKGQIVAVTGDGVNDSPALKKADIGIAMNSGSDVAKDAANMILMDDNFASIVNGIEEGRIIFDNLKKSIAYTLSSNIPELVPFVLFVIADLPIALSAVLVLCVDLGTDLWPAISLALEKAEADLMKRHPRNAKTDRLVTAKLISFSYLQIGIIQAIAALVTFFYVMYDAGNNNGFTPASLIGLADQFASRYSTADYDICRLAVVPGNRFLIGCARNTTLLDDMMPLELIPQGMNITDAFSAGNIVDYCYNTDHFNAELTCQLSKTWTRDELLRSAQSACFLAIVITQWADLLICKTRHNSLFTQGMTNWWLNGGLLFETALACFIVYVPFMNVAFGTNSVKWYWWGIPMPFALLIVIYDEIRKLIIRKQGSKGWVHRFTYY